MLEDIAASVTHPFKEQVSFKTLAIYALLFLILGWIAYEGLRMFHHGAAFSAPSA